MTSLSDPTGSSLVGFIQADASAVARTVQDKNRDTLDIFDFIAYGDGRDEGVALQAAINAAVAQGKVLRGRPGITIGSTVPIVFDVNLHYDGMGMNILPIGLTSGAFLSIRGSVGSHTAGGVFRGLKSALPNANATDTLVGLSVGDASGNTSGIKFYDLSLHRYDTNLKFVEGNVYILDFYGCDIGGATTYNVSWTPTTNAGEKISFHGGTISDAQNSSHTARALYIDPNASSPDMHFHMVSMSYNDINGEINVGSVDLFSCHQENSSAQPHWVVKNTAGKTRSFLRLFGGSITGGPLGNQLEPATGRDCYILADPGAGIVVHSTVVGGYVNPSNVADCVTRLVRMNGTGSFLKIRLDPFIDGDAVSHLPPYLCDDLNQIYNAGSGSFAGFTQNVATGITFSSDASGYGTDSGSRLITGASGNSASYLQKFPVRTGQNVWSKVAIKSEGVTALTVATARLVFRAQDGTTQISATNLARSVTTTGTNGFTVQFAYTTAPVGAAFVELQMYVSGLTGVVGFSNETLYVTD